MISGVSRSWVVWSSNRALSLALGTVGFPQQPFLALLAAFTPFLLAPALNRAAWGLTAAIEENAEKADGLGTPASRRPGAPDESWPHCKKASLPASPQSRP